MTSGREPFPDIDAEMRAYGALIDRVKAGEPVEAVLAEVMAVRHFPEHVARRAIAADTGAPRDEWDDVIGPH